MGMLGLRKVVMYKMGISGKEMQLIFQQKA